MTQQDLQSRVFRAVTEQCSLLPLPNEWQGLELEHGVLGRPRSIAALQAQLNGQFSSAELIEAGVSVQGRRGDLVPQTIFSSPNTCVVPIKRSVSDHPLALYAETAHLPSTSCAPLTMLEDYRTRYAMGVSQNRLLVVFTGMDLAILRGLDLPAVFGNSLSSLSREGLRTVAEGLGWINRPVTPAFHDDVVDYVDARLAQTVGLCIDEHAKEDSEDDIVSDVDSGDLRLRNSVLPRLPHLTLEVRPKVILVDFNLSRLSAESPVECQRTLEFLREISSIGQYDLSRVGVWRPTEDEIRAFATHQQHGTRDSLLEAMLESLASSTRPITFDDEQTEPTIVQALQRRRELASNRNASIFETLRAQRDLEGAFDQHFQETLEFAEQHNDPLKRSATMVLAEQFRELHRASMLTPGNHRPIMSDRTVGTIVKMMKAIK